MELCLFMSVSVVLFFKQKTAYEMRISDWSSYVCSSDLKGADVSASDLTLVKPSISQTKVRARTPSINRTITPSATQEPAWIRYVLRSDKSRVGKACVSRARSRWVTVQSKKH